MFAGSRAGCCATMPCSRSSSASRSASPRSPRGLAMLYSQVIDDALEETVGKAGLPRASLARELDRAAAALDKIRQWKKDGTLPLLSLPARRDDLAGLRPHAERFSQFEQVVVMGMGGSSMSGKALVAL